MIKKEQQWVDWFTDEYVQRTQEQRAAGVTLRAVDERVPWSLIEDKGIELKVVNTNAPGWYAVLRSRWVSIFPKKWCLDHDYPPPVSETHRSRWQLY